MMQRCLIGPIDSVVSQQQDYKKENFVPLSFHKERNRESEITIPYLFILFYQMECIDVLIDYQLTALFSFPLLFFLLPIRAAI